MQFNQKNIKDWSYYHFPELEQKGVRHGFFTALSPSHVLQGEEKAEFLRNFGLVDLIIMKQEHGVDVHVIEDGHSPESGDGLILLSRGIAGIVKTADCQPVILCEPDYPVASIIHAGWRGTANKITKRAVEKMVQIGVDKKSIIALLGPSIGPCCYEVKNDVYDIFVEKGFSDVIFKKKNGSLFLDIRRANIETLQSEGVQNIYSIGLCTCCSQNLFNSYRGGEKEKRQINFVSIML